MSTAAASTTPSVPRPGLVNRTVLGLELRRVLVRDPVTMFFIVVLPAFLYLIFGSSESYAGEQVGNGNVAMTIMIAMAAYGAVTATVGIGGRAAVERSLGWGRQLGLTPLPDRSYVAAKVLLAVIVATMPVALIYAVGSRTGAEGEAGAWALSALVLVAGAMVFALYGLCFGLWFRSETAVSGAGGSVVVLGFLGNIFFPLDGVLLDVARWTPLYGYASLARYPVTEGWMITGEGALIHEALWIPVANVLAWTVLLGVLATWLVRRSRGRA